MPNLREFERRLAETIAWCTPRIGLEDGAHALRSSILQPAIYDAHQEWVRYYWEGLAARIEVVNWLAGKRASLVERVVEGTLSTAARLAGGRLILYFPDDNLFDGAAEVESQGYFDVDNAPPWDTWVSYIRDADWQETQAVLQVDERSQAAVDLSYLVSWVPADYVALAHAGIWANPEECIRWADDLDTAFTRQLRRAGLLAALVA